MTAHTPSERGPKNLEADRSPSTTDLTERQATVLRALVATYVEQVGPVSSGALSQRMPTSLSPASIRNTLAELHDAGLIDKAHASAGRVPTPLGMSVFIDRLLDLADLGPQQQQLLDRALDGVDAAETPRQTSHLLSEHTRQLGFVMAPRVEHLRMRSVHLVAVAEQRVLAVLVAENGGVIQRVFDYPERLTARELDRAATLLATRLAGRTLVGLRRVLEEERERLRGEADQWMRRVWALGLQTCNQDDEDDLVIATRIALLDQPEFSDPERIRGLFAALETNQKLLGLLRELAKADSGEARMGFRVSLGQALDEPSLRDCALVAMPYGHLPLSNPGRLIATGGGTRAGRMSDLDSSDRSRGGSEDGSLGVLGVIGPQRMDYGRVIPLVSYCAELVTRKLLA
jgi:heat-inducible transcriptional repressor